MPSCAIEIDPSQVRLHVTLDASGRPSSARAEGRLSAPVARIWPAVFDLEGYPGRVPMIHRVRREGDRVTVQLRFKIALFSVGFAFVADALREPERWLELRWVSGEPRGLRLRLELSPDGPDQCRMATTAELDVLSLGWMVKVFLRHHPEIQHGVLPGIALNLLDSMRRAVGASFLPAES